MSAVTFDLWNTLIVEQPPGLFAPRVEAWLQVLDAAGIPVETDELDRAHRVALADYHLSWMRNQSFCSEEATSSALRSLGLTVDAVVRGHLVEAFHLAGLRSPIASCPHAVEVLESLTRAGVPTAVICDIGLTPSSALVPRLHDLGLAEHLNAMTWSDELGVYKPDRAAFDTTLAVLGAAAGQSLHVGDRRRTDIAGARAAGMTTVRYRGVFDDQDPLEEADHVIDDLLEVLALLGAAEH